MPTTLKMPDGTLIVSANVFSVVDNGSTTITLTPVGGGSAYVLTVLAAQFVAARAQIDNAISAPTGNDLVMIAPISYQVLWSINGGTTWNPMPAPVGVLVIIQITSVLIDLSSVVDCQIASGVATLTYSGGVLTSNQLSVGITGAFDILLRAAGPTNVATIPGGFVTA